MTRITPDTNVLVRAAVPEDGVRSAQAQAALGEATLIAVTLPTLCEFVWVPRSVYKYSKGEIEGAIHTPCSATSVTCDRQALDAGLSSSMKGGDTFVSFDRKAARVLQQIAQQARLVGELP